MSELPAPLDGLPEVSRRDVPPGGLRDELLDVIATAVAAHPRSRQRELGPSEIGHPCQRWLGYRLLDVEPVNTNQETSWRPTVGVAVHEWLQGTFAVANHGQAVARWLTECQVSPAELDGVPIVGRSDLYDRETATVIDWKIVGPTTLRNVRAHGPAPQYQVQAHLYGRGWTRRLVPVERVAIFYLPSNGELRDHFYWETAYDEQVALDAMARLEQTSALTKQFGRRALAVLPTADHYCTRCPFFLPAVTDPTEACPGHKPSEAEVTQPTL